VAPGPLQVQVVDNLRRRVALVALVIMPNALRTLPRIESSKRPDPRSQAAA
jgi:hypothetical protein